MIRLGGMELTVTEALTIDGSTGVDVVITADALGDDVLVAGTLVTDVAASGAGLLDDNSRVLNFSALSGDLTLSNLTVTDGNTTAVIDIGAFEVQPIVSSADFDSDGDIDGGDFLAWQRGFGSSTPAKSDGDANNDGNVDGTDLEFWQAQFGGPAPLAQPQPPVHWPLHRVMNPRRSSRWQLSRRFFQNRLRQRLSQGISSMPLWQPSGWE